MCGIVGAWHPGRALHEEVARAAQTLRHRGPDDSGLWQDAACGIVLGHMRLAIQDLTSAGHQPMASRCGRYQLILNGELYNHMALRAQLPGKIWRGHADTETLLACVSAWGFERALSASVGMFALAIFDTHTHTLHLARDRLGEKPLYYGYVGGAFAFASELKALRALPGFDAGVDRHALHAYLECGYVPAPASIYRSIRKLPPGTSLSINFAALSAGRQPSPQPYWSAAQVALQGEREPLRLSDAAALERLEQLLGDAVEGQLISDVPLGAFLSGGIDSSTVAALMCVRAPGTVRTFSLGFGEEEYDESRHARAVAAHLGTVHTELVADPADLLSLVASMPEVYDEPFADASQLPTCMLARLARGSVTVALSGDGGDELFGGYNRHVMGANHWPRIRRVPRVVRRGLAAVVHGVPADAWDNVADLYRWMVPKTRQVRTPGEKLIKIADVLASEHEDALYRGLIGGGSATSLLAADALASPVAQTLPPLASLPLKMMLSDALSYLPDDVLVKVDRASMAVALEMRAPFLDHRVFEFAWALPLAMKIRGSTGKWLLRQLLYRHVPRALVERPKMGFAVPLAGWLRGALRPWAEELLSPARLQREGFFQAAAVQTLWRQQLAGRRRAERTLWRVLMFQQWLAAPASAVP
jgi:asparagine synthase (glutamine-hydrolysing)